MPARAARPCNKPWCKNLRPCPVHDVEQQRVDVRPSAARRGYDYRWRRKRAAFLRTHPFCECGAAATVADHHPLTRVELVRAGVEDPDAEQYLVARCASCHSRKTAVRDGGYGNAREGD